jgi:hypothetical protein
VNLFEITNACDYRCSFCYTVANDASERHHTSLEDIDRVAQMVKEDGGYAMTLTGGEPTLHPDIFRAIRNTRRRGLMVTMPTNGHRLGRDARLARRLRKSGLNMAVIQLDTFNKDVQRIHRNNTFVDEKLQAIENCQAAGLKYLLLPTISSYNLTEAGDLVSYALPRAPLMQGVTFQLYYQDRTAGLGPQALVTREDLVASLIDSKAVPDLGPEHFWPMPQYGPLRLSVHPDCGVLAVLLVEEGRARPLDHFTDLEALYSALARTPWDSSPVVGVAGLAYQALRFTPAHHRRRLLRAIAGTVRGKGRSSLVVVAAESFMSTPYQDQARIRACAAVSRRPDGSSHQCGCFASRPAEGLRA